MNNIEFDKEYVCYIGNRRMPFSTNDCCNTIYLRNCFGKFVFHIYKFHIYKDVVLMYTMKDNILYRYILCNIDDFNKEMFDYYKITVINNEKY